MVLREEDNMNTGHLQYFYALEKEYEELRDELYEKIENIIAKMNKERHLFPGRFDGITEVTFCFESDEVRVLYDYYYYGETNERSIELPFSLIEDNSDDKIEEFLQEYLEYQKHLREEKRRVQDEIENAKLLDNQKRQYRELYEKFNGVLPESL